MDGGRTSAADPPRLAAGEPLRPGPDDIDHLLVGPGGAFVVETKWSSQSWESESGLDRRRAAVRQASANARRVRLWTPFRTNGITVRPVVVLWGARDGGNRPDTPATVVDGTAVVQGLALRRWVEQAGGTVPTPALDRVWPAVLDQVARRDVSEHEASPMPMSFWDFLLRGIGCLISTLLAALAVGQVLRLTQSLWATMLGGVVLAAVGIAVSRWQPARWFGWAWTVGTSLSSAAILIAFASLALRQSP